MDQLETYLTVKKYLREIYDLATSDQSQSGHSDAAQCDKIEDVVHWAWEELGFGNAKMLPRRWRVRILYPDGEDRDGNNVWASVRTFRAFSTTHVQKLVDLFATDFSYKVEVEVDLLYDAETGEYHYKYYE